jgi:ADP-ribose pyrophosphatase
MPAKKSSPVRKARQATILSHKVVFRGPVFYVTSDRIIEPGGIRARRDIVCHPGSVVVMAVDDSRSEPRLLLARQYRYAAQTWLWELPAGRIDPGEDELRAAQRELVEETGFTARRWKLALRFWASPGFLDETMALYVARDLEARKARPEEDEVISKRFFPLPAARRMVMKGKIPDAKTIAGILWLAAQR